MATINTIDTLSVENQTFYDRTLLERELPELHLYEDADKKSISKGKGTEVSFRKFSSLKVPATSLSEGVTPAGSNLEITEIKAKAKQEGDYVKVSDVLDMQGKDPVITETSELCGEQAALTVDTRIRDVIGNGTTVQYANNKVGRANLTDTDILTSIEIRKAKKRLKKSNIRPFADGYYHMLISPDQEFDLKNDESKTGFVEVAKYAASEKLLSGEIGRYDGVRICVSSNVEVAKQGSVNVHKALLYGRHTYGVVDVESQGAKAKIIVKPLGSGGTDDPLNQRATIGWKAMFTAVRLNELGICRVETGASAV